MDELVGIVPTTERFLNVTWVTSNLCNFNCSYCSPNNHIGDYTNTSNKHLSNCRRLIDKICSGGGYLYSKISTLEKEIEEEKRLRGKS